MHTICTKRLLLAPCSRFTDVRKLVDWLNDKEITKYSEQRHQRHTVYSQYDFIDSFVPPSLYLAIIHNNEIIGSITARVDKHNGVADLGILIGDKSRWGLGFGQEAWIGLMNQLFTTGIRKVEAGCMATNLAMIGIFKKSKMEREGCREHHFIDSTSLSGYTTTGMEMWGRFNHE